MLRISFRKNDTHQMTLADSYFGLTEREQKTLEKAWAKVFVDDVFPMINEGRFECLDSDKASRPNNPVNAIVGTLIIKELFNLSDDEIVDSVVKDYQYETNNTSDSSTLKDHHEKVEKQEEESLVVTDGAYAGEENTKLAADKNVKHVTTERPGSDVPDIICQFELNETETKIIKCPMVNLPESCSYIKATGVCTASFERSCCENCPHKNQYRVKIFKRVAKNTATGNKIRRTRLQKEMQTELYRTYARLRNCVKTSFPCSGTCSM